MKNRMSNAEFRRRYSNKNKRPRWGWKNKSECWGGCRISGFPRLHDSREEASYCNQLKLQKNQKDIEDYEAQKQFDLYDPDGNRVGAHRVDFLITRNGQIEVHEYKGKHLVNDPAYKTKKALFKFNYPDIPYTTVTKNDIVF